MDIIFACFKLGLIGFAIGHAVLLYVIYWLAQRYPTKVRTVGRRLALMLLGPETPPPMPESQPSA